MLQKPPWRREQSSRGRTGIVCLRVKHCGIKAVTALAMQRTVALCPWAACRKPFSGAAAHRLNGWSGFKQRVAAAVFRGATEQPATALTAGCRWRRAEPMPGQTSVNNSVKKALGKRSESQTVEALTTVSIAHPAGLRPLLGSREGNLTPFFERSPRRSAPRSGCFPVPGGAGRPWWC